MRGVEKNALLMAEAGAVDEESSTAEAAAPQPLHLGSRAARAAVVSLALCGTAAFCLYGARRSSTKLSVANTEESTELQGLDLAQIKSKCMASFTGNDKCCWTRAWNCPDQAPGSKGAAYQDATMAHHCCCNEGLWKMSTGCEEPEHTWPPTTKSPDAEEAPADDGGSAALAAAFDAAEGKTTEKKPNEKKPAEENSTSLCSEAALKAHRANRQATDGTDIPEQCHIPREEYSKGECKNLHIWQNMSHNIRPTPCKVDPKSKLMSCARNETCAGGRQTKEHFASVKKVVNYDCKASCQGALLINCCNTCIDAQKHADQWGLDAINCTGCTDTELKDAAEESQGCQIKNGQFSCESHDQCELGDPVTTCEEVHQTCSIYPCDQCDSPHLRAQCCFNCLRKLCADGETGETTGRMVCQGCEDPPQKNNWWQSLGGFS